MGFITPTDTVLCHGNGVQLLLYPITMSTDSISGGNKQGEQYQQEVVAFNYNTTLSTNNPRFVLLQWQRGTK